MSDTSSGNLSADNPITDLTADCLGYRPFAKNIATILDNATTREDCLVLGIHGEWGSGKTSAINLVVKELEGLQKKLYKYPKKLELFSPFSSFVPDGIPTRTTIIHFSPWLFSNQENLTTAFFHELEKQLDNTWGNIKCFLKVIAALTLPSLEALSYLNPTTSKLVGNTTQHLIKNLQKRPSLEQAKQALNKALKAQKRPILIIIDDIDRLPADEMRQIFRMVKSVADLPYVTYLLGFDRKIVKRALEKDTDLEGPEWSEKIVQGSFDLPYIMPFRIELYFWNKLKTDIPDLYNQLHKSTVNYFQQYLYPQLKNPRQVSRLINALNIGWLSVKNTVNPMCFIIIESWRLFNHGLYEFIKTNATDLIYCIHHHKELEQALNLPEQTTNKLQNQIKSYNIESFFKLESLDQSGNAIRIFSEKTFYNYFLYGTHPTLLSPSELVEIENNLDNDNIEEAEKTIKDFSNQTLDYNLSKNRALIQDWQESISTYPEDRIQKIINFTVYISDFLINTDPTSVEYNIQTHIEFLLNKSLINFDENTQNTLLIELFEKFPFCFLLIFSFNKVCFQTDLNIIQERDIVITCIKENQKEIKNIYQKKLKERFERKEENSLSIHILLLFFNVLDQNWIQQFLTKNLDYTLYIMQFIIDDTITNIERNKDFLPQLIQINEFAQLTMMYYVRDKMLHLKTIAINITKDMQQNEKHKQTAQEFLEIYHKYIQPQ